MTDWRVEEILLVSRRPASAVPFCIKDRNDILPPRVPVGRSALSRYDCGNAEGETRAMNSQSNSASRWASYRNRCNDMLRGMLAELRSWDVFRWAVIALLFANILLVAGVYRGARTSIANLKQDHGSESELANIRASFTKDMSEMRAALEKDVADTKTGLTQAVSDLRASVDAEMAKTNTKLDSLTGSIQHAPQKKVRR